MVLMPYLHGITRAHFPFGVCLLVLINCFVFFGLQSGDKARYAAEIEQYSKGPLPRIELPLYETWLRSQKEQQDADSIRDLAAAGEVGPAVQHMENNEAFMQKLHAGEIVTERHPDYRLWQQARSNHEAALAKVFTNRYHYDPEHPSWLTALTHQFLHGDLDHIFGNMLVLILIAPAVEALIGTFLFLGIYLCAGFAALGMHLLLNHDAAGLLGASGAIAGAMGAFATLLGRQKIPFFYSIVVYFDVIRAPALLALPIWIANELVQLFWLGNGHVAYGAHFGGLLMGALLAWPLRGRAARRLAQVAAGQSDSSSESTVVSGALARARRQMAAMSYDEARKSYAQVAQEAQGDPAVLQECLNVTALAPASEAYHITVAQILRMPGHKNETHALVLDTFRNYLQKAQPVPRIRVSTLVMLCERFMRQRNLPELERCVRLLHATAPRDPRSSEAARRSADFLANAGERGRAIELNALFVGR
ncbi:rhomboid family intramembrane serine protease [Uliginosibacterium sp. H3]|uniref:Rhomboid family intramembrane serine protease n=1 Tax=Uliginosibacterium silvisoli TaxID=3114758 RepID=A0ABU6JZC9_9RHOO|nr:rhomboid family intramembrane serine protease [Uliginosibacterium sp. H3]